ncbi:MAG: PDZ domain-containing protein [Planctomycetes bacterium]|nr:PDZ domain-containing protein [Planctomycetota bacterium]
MQQLRAAVFGTMLGIGAFGVGPVLAQDDKPVPSQPQPDAPATIDQWIKDLGASSFRTRLRAENELRKAGQSALPDLKRAAEQGADPEVQWRARRLVRQIEHGDARGLVQRSRDGDRDLGGLPGATPAWPPAGGIQQQFDEFFRDMERRFGIDIPRASFFQDDFFRDLQDQMQNGVSRSQGMSMQVGPDGAVRVEIKETDADGKVETKVYEAPDMDTFQSQYPGVLQRGGLGGLGLRLWSDDEPMRHPLFQLRRGSLGDPLATRPVPGFQRAAPNAAADLEVQSGQRLGVAVRPEIAAELREHLGLDDGVGLMVQSVAPDSLASTLGLEAGDIVVRIGTRSIGSPADVQAALAGIEAGGTVEVTFLRKGAQQVATAKKPEARPAEAKRDDASPKPSGLQPRSDGGGPAKIR